MVHRRVTHAKLSIQIIENPIDHLWRITIDDATLYQQLKKRLVCPCRLLSACAVEEFHDPVICHPLDQAAKPAE